MMELDPMAQVGFIIVEGRKKIGIKEQIEQKQRRVEKLV